MKTPILIAYLLCITTAASAQVVSTKIDVTAGCAERQSRTQKLCVPAGQKAGTPQIVEISKNGASSYSWSPDADNINCIQIYIEAVGVGEDCINIFNNRICNCKGRGWIELSVSLPSLNN